jgi:predicted RNA polymerase sigma factor
VDRRLDAGIVDDVFRRESGPVLATLIRMLGDFDRAEDAFQDAIAAYRKALALTENDAQRRFLQRRLAELGAAT